MWRKALLARRWSGRVRFLRLLKSGAEKTQKAAGAEVGWQLRFSQQMWRLYREQALSALLEKPPKRSLGKLSCLEISQMQRYYSMVVVVRHKVSEGGIQGIATDANGEEIVHWAKAAGID